MLMKQWRLGPFEKELQFVDADFRPLSRASCDSDLLGRWSASKFDLAAREIKANHQNVASCGCDDSSSGQAFVLSVGKIDDNYLYRDLRIPFGSKKAARWQPSIFTDEEN